MRSCRSPRCSRLGEGEGEGAGEGEGEGEGAPADELKREIDGWILAQGR